MIKEVEYNGYSASPSDYGCVDGDLAMSLNALNEEGALRPVLQPKRVLYTSSGSVVKCVHETGIYTHYIIIEDNDIKYKKDNILTPIHAFPSNIEIYQITPIGNTLVVLTSDGMYYFLWKENKYISLGNELPELNVSPYISTQIMNATNIKQNFKLDFEMDSDELGVKIDFEEKGNLTDVDNPSKVANLSSTDKTSISEKVFPVVNTCSKALKEKGYFLEPFYIRFAYRMYDGSHVKHTAPVLLVPTTWGKPIMAVNESNGEFYFNPIFSLSTLHYDINDVNMEYWGDIITHIDVFVTEPLIDYTDSADSLLRILKYNPFYNVGIGSYKEYVSPMIMNNDKWEDIDNVIGTLNEGNVTVKSQGTMRFVKSGSYLVGYEYKNLLCLSHFCDNEYLVFKPHKYHLWCETAFGQIQPITNDAIDDVCPGWSIFAISDMLPARDVLFHLNVDANASDVELVEYCRVTMDFKSIDSDYYIETRRVDELEYNDVLTSSNNFYKINEIELQDNFMDNIFSKQFVLQNLVTRPTLSDIGSGKDKVISTMVFNYNNRVNVIVDKLRITSSDTSLKKQNPATNSDNDCIIKKAYVEIYENNQYAYVEIPTENLAYKALTMFSFPNNNAKNLVLYVVKNGVLGNSYYRYKIKLQQHDFLNLSYMFNGFASLFGDNSVALVYETESLSGESDFIVPTNDTIEYGNIIRLSDVNNPFRFSEEYSVSLPVSKIYALSTAAKALSQGQFGQYPLYAFTSDGIWALEITSTGTYSARQPLSRDVVINSNSITQLDNAVVFASDRGIMLLSGSNVISISDRLNTEDLFDLTSIPMADKLIEIYNNSSVFFDIEETPFDPENNDERLFFNSLKINDIKIGAFGDYIKDCRMVYDYTHQHLVIYNPNVNYAYIYSFKSQMWGIMLSDFKENVNSYPEALVMTKGNYLVDFSKYENNYNKVLVITRPFKMGEPNIHKTINTIIQRGIFNSRKIAQILYGSNDLKNWILVRSSQNIKMNGFRGSPYKYYRIAIVRNFDKSESLQGFSVQYEQRLTNKLR